ncbi:MAG: iron ABC transporter permease [Actinomycetota bacterium]|nr:iron ABC transporter permease [Actinomycetota bacterium]
MTTQASPLRLTFVFGGIIAALILIGAMSLAIGYASFDQQIILDIRAPRLTLTLLVGAGLAVAGVLLQAVFHNPLAAPSIIGVSASGAAGASIGAALGISFNSVWLAGVGALVAGAGLAVVRGIATRNGRTDSTALLLGGVAVSFFALAIVLIAAPFVDRAVGRSFTFWANGSFALATWSGVLAVLPFLLVGFTIAVFLIRDLDPLTLGASAAQAMGFDVARTTALSLMAVVLIVAPAVTVVGVVSFVGLVVPHALRQLIGPRSKVLLPASALAGGALVAAADFVARVMIAPLEIPVGAVTALVGAPVFLLLLRRMVRDRIIVTR